MSRVARCTSCGTVGEIYLYPEDLCRPCGEPLVLLRKQQNFDMVARAALERRKSKQGWKRYGASRMAQQRGSR